jgi:hypothetical protein
MEHIERIVEKINYSGKRIITEDVNLNDPNIDREMNQAMDQLMRELPQSIDNYAKEVGDRDGELELQENTINEASPLLLGASALLAAPKIAELLGKGLGKIGQSVDSQTLRTWGEKLSKLGHSWHDKYLGVIERIISPFTRNATPEQKRAIANGILMSLIITFGVTSFQGAATAAAQGKAATAAVETGLGGVKASEIVAAAKKIIPKVMGMLIK